MNTLFNPVDAENKPITANAFARALDVKPPTVHQWMNRVRPVSAKMAVAIERVSGGHITRKVLRPNDWHEIWPELAEVA